MQQQALHLIRHFIGIPLVQVALVLAVSFIAALIVRVIFTYLTHLQGSLSWQILPTSSGISSSWIMQSGGSLPISGSGQHGF